MLCYVHKSHHICYITCVMVCYITCVMLCYITCYVIHNMLYNICYAI